MVNLAEAANGPRGADAVPAERMRSPRSGCGPRGADAVPAERMRSPRSGCGPREATSVPGCPVSANSVLSHVIGPLWRWSQRKWLTQTSVLPTHWTAKNAAGCRPLGGGRSEQWRDARVVLYRRTLVVSGKLQVSTHGTDSIETGATMGRNH